MQSRARAAFAGALFLIAVTACSPRQMAINRMASALASASSVYERDNDPEFVRLAAPLDAEDGRDASDGFPESVAASAHGVQRLHGVLLMASCMSREN
jgi:hypothetical protein